MDTFQKLIVLILTFFFIAFYAVIVFSAQETMQCEDCPYDDPCIYSYAIDNCNSCTGYTWCIRKPRELEEKWRAHQTSWCTAVYCEPEPIIIPNPFEPN